MHKYAFVLLILQLGILGFSNEEEPGRSVYSLNEDWLTIAADSIDEYTGFELTGFNTDDWVSVNVPHNWDRYEGYRRLQHGNRHGYAWYRKKFRVEESRLNGRYFLFFEGVGSYAIVYLNGELVGEHAGGRTSFTLDVTDQIELKGENLLSVRADHPSFIEDLPWVCGGCSSEYGFSEGSQPMGIFRPVHLVVTNQVRVEPFGVHVWNGTTVSEESAQLNINTEIKNYSNQTTEIQVTHKLLDRDGSEKVIVSRKVKLKGSETRKVELKTPPFGSVNLWSIENPYLYTLKTEIYQDDVLVDQVETPYGIRWIKWEAQTDGTRLFYLNGKQTFINGTAEYEHNMGMSHAFTDEMVEARVSQMKSAGFNAFRDAHQPHNFRYHHGWDSLGMLWWTQMAAHIWYDTPEFRDNFKQLLRDWVKERRNSPSIILWGLENESTLPTDFARECTEIIREMDPTSPTQRLVTTCNGGTGTDWNVPQNWTGTYGGNPDLYHEDVQRQQLIGEYGAWRTLDKHTEGPFDQRGVLSEDRMTLLMEKKVWLADSVKDKTCGHFQWIFTSHENPGRNQSGEGLRELDRVGPINYKGLLTPWGEPTDAYYMYRSNFAPKEMEPMVYIVSHTWPNRWTEVGVKDSLVVYSNCDEVELFNGSRSLGKRQNPGLGKHFQWDQVDIQTNLITAKGYVNGKEVATDYILLHHLPEESQIKALTNNQVKISDSKSSNYLYRVNCGGGDYMDSNGNLWMADVHLKAEKESIWGSTSWTDDFEDMPAFYASQRRVFDPIFNTADPELFQSFRFGMDKLQFHFPVPDGAYEVELYFIEPWYGTGGGLDCTNWRIFDVAVNGETVLNDLDIWKEVGHDKALVKTVSTDVEGGELTINFPEVKSGQAVISGIAIRTNDHSVKPAEASPRVIQLKSGKSNTWLDWGSYPFQGDSDRVRGLPSDLFGAEWIKRNVKSTKVEFSLSDEADIYVAALEDETKPEWLRQFDDTKNTLQLADGKVIKYSVYKKRFSAGSELSFEDSRFGKNYIVMAKAAAKLEPPYDLKPKIPYDEDVVILQSDDLKIEEKFGLGCVTFLSDRAQKVSWPIQTGVADYHAIHFKYSNETGADLKATFNLIAADGTLMQSTPVAFPETRTGMYREETTFTESMINAGDYQVQISGEGLKELSIRGIRVQ
ncbi:MAG: malectin domain-containing carbohydrate-binding protein [Marinoscillum sp.]